MTVLRSVVSKISFSIVHTDKNWTREKNLGPTHHTNGKYETESINQIKKNLIGDCLKPLNAAASGATGVGVCWRRPLGGSCGLVLRCLLKQALVLSLYVY